VKRFPGRFFPDGNPYTFMADGSGYGNGDGGMPPSPLTGDLGGKAPSFEYGPMVV
jgi:hypothetical protein